MAQVHIIMSPAEDHDAAHAYACYMADVKRKSWSHTYMGARWELALARFLGDDVHHACMVHLTRVDAADPDDFIFDFKVGNVKIDAKSTRSFPTRKNNLLVTTSRLAHDVVYALGDLQADRHPLRGEVARDLKFEGVGWQLGSSSSFHPCDIPGMDHLSMVDRSQLIPLAELVSGPPKEGEKKEESARPHIVGGKFKSDKYDWCQPGFVPLKITDSGAQRLLWSYAEIRREIDTEFSDDLQACLWGAGHRPTCDFCDEPATHRFERSAAEVYAACERCSAGGANVEPYDAIAVRFGISKRQL